MQHHPCCGRIERPSWCDTFSRRSLVRQSICFSKSILTVSKFCSLQVLELEMDFRAPRQSKVREGARLEKKVKLCPDTCLNVLSDASLITFYWVLFRKLDRDGSATITRIAASDYNLRR